MAANSPRPLRPDSLNYWSHTPQFLVSLLKAYYGERARPENDFGYDFLPKIPEGINWYQNLGGMFTPATR